MSSGRKHTPRPNPLDQSQAISYRNHRKSLGYFSHLAPLILFPFTKRQSQKGKRAQCPSEYAPARGITSGKANLRNSASEQHRSEETSQQWRAASNIAPI